jgi:hypothetical protein
MNRINAVLVLVLLSAAFMTAVAEEMSPQQMRTLVAADLKAKGSTTDSVGTPIRVTGYGEKIKDFYLIPVVRGGKLSAVYRDDPKRASVTEVSSKNNVQTLKLDLFSLDGARRELERQGVIDPTPRLICVGPISLLGSLTAGWYHDTGDSFVLLSLTSRLVTESDIARYWPEHLAALRAVGQ